MGRRRYRKQEKSLRERLSEHRRKITRELQKPFPDEGLILYWRREIKAFEKGIDRARRRQRGR